MAGEDSGTGALPVAVAARVARSRPYFLRKRCKATVDTRALQVWWMKSKTLLESPCCLEAVGRLISTSRAIWAILSPDWQLSKKWLSIREE